MKKGLLITSGICLLVFCGMLATDTKDYMTVVTSLGLGTCVLGALYPAY